MPQARLPIVYVRGFAGGAQGIEHTVDDPFYGFNVGSTHVRVDGDDQPVFYSFEGPLLRLLEQEGYQLLVDGGQRHYLQTHEQVPPQSVWIHRFYDLSARPPTGARSNCPGRVTGIPAPMSRWPRHSSTATSTTTRMARKPPRVTPFTCAYCQ
jgi:hypothetical protein